jgi:hypothetical protein
MTDQERKAVERAIGAIEAAKKDVQRQYYSQAWMNHETALAELRALLDEKTTTDR